MGLRAQLIFVIWTFVGATNLLAQESTNEIISTEKTAYTSEADNLVTIRKISILPVVDNVGGIYSRPLELHLIDEVNKDHHWDYIRLNLAGPLISPEELASNPSQVAQLAAGLDTDAIVATRLTKGPNGISITVNMFLTKDSLLFSRAELTNFKRFEIAEVKDKLTELIGKLKKKIPYEGMILSRQGNRVTVNLGQRDGMEPDKIVSVVQIIKLNRHPKFNFLINTEKEVLGKVKLLKVDKTLSFGKIIVEKEKGAIQRNAKLSGLDFVKYSNYDTLSENTTTQDELLKRPDGALSFGKNAVAWLPKRPPTFGEVSATFGNSLYSYTMQQSVGLDASSFFNPFIGFAAELWMTPEWTTHASLRQGIVSIENPLPGSTPSSLSASMSYYELLIGYKYRLSPSVWGAQVEILGGMANYDFKVDDSSPRGLTSTRYSGLKLGLSGSYPLDKRETWSLGTNLFFFFRPSIAERPVSSGSGADSSINQFGVFAFKKLSMNLKMKFNLDFELLKTIYSAGSTATSSSQKFTSVNMGLNYMF